MACRQQNESGADICLVMCSAWMCSAGRASSRGCFLDFELCCEDLRGKHKCAQSGRCRLTICHPQACPYCMYQLCSPAMTNCKRGHHF